MTDIDDNLEQQDEATSSKINKKRILIFLLPVLIVIGIAGGMYHALHTKTEEVSPQSYSVMPAPDDGSGQKDKMLIFYDLPEISTQIKTLDGSKEDVRIKISIELSKMEDVKAVEVLLSRLNDIIINHTSELTSDEINGANGLYWLKQELMYRINLVIEPIEIENLNFKSFEVKKNN